MEFKMLLVPAKKQKNPACIRKIQVHKLWTKVYSQHTHTHRPRCLPHTYTEAHPSHEDAQTLAHTQRAPLTPTPTHRGPDTSETHPSHKDPPTPTHRTTHPTKRPRPTCPSPPPAQRPTPHPPSKHKETQTPPHHTHTLSPSCVCACMHTYTQTHWCSKQRLNTNKNGPYPWIRNVMYWDAAHTVSMGIAWKPHKAHTAPHSEGTELVPGIRQTTSTHVHSFDLPLSTSLSYAVTVSNKIQRLKRFKRMLI